MHKIFYIVLILGFYSCSNPANEQSEQKELAKTSEKQGSSSKAKDQVKTESDSTQAYLRCSYEANTATLGIGIVSLNGEKFAIYNDPELSEVFWNDNIYNVYTHNQKCCAKFHDPEYGILNFICLETTDAHYKIIVNDSTIKYMRNDPRVKFASWEAYIESGLGIRRSLDAESKPNEVNPIRTEPNEQSQTIAFEQEHENLCPIELKGDWLKISVNCFYGSENNDFVGSCEELIGKCEEPITGWIKWRDGNKLLIDVFLLT